MKSTIFSLIALASAVIAQADYFQIRTPRKGTTLSAGEISTIRWDNGLEGKVLVNILKGDDPHLMMPTGMAFVTSGQLSTQKWKVPDNLDPNETYALEFNYKLPNGQVTQSFSDQFKVSSDPPVPSLEQSRMTTGSMNDMEFSSSSSAPKMLEDSNGIIQGTTNTNLRQTSTGSSSQDMRQTSQGTQRKPSSPTRGRMRIIIQYPEDEQVDQNNNVASVEEASPVRMNSGPRAGPTRAQTARAPASVGGSVLDSYAVNSASNKKAH